MDLSYSIILLGTLICSPFVLKIAMRQDNQTKFRLKAIFLILLVAEILLDFSNWESFDPASRSGIALALAYPQSLLGIFFGLTLVQLLLLATESYVHIAVLLNGINSVLIFVALRNVSQLMDKQIVSLASVAVVFLVLASNVVGLAFLHKNKKFHVRPGVLILLAMSIILVMLAVMTGTKPAISKEQAVTLVSQQSEVVQYVTRVPNAHIQFNHVDPDTHEYVIQVFEVKDGHTATFNWYAVNKTSGAIRKEF